VAFVGLDREFTLTTDVCQMGGNGTYIHSTAGDFHHHLGYSSDGAPDLFDLSGSDVAGRAGTPEAEQVEKGGSVGRESDRSSSHIDSPK
jgi:hypothetical protein